MNSPTKVLVIGLDSASPDLLRKWCASGDLPVLRSLQEDGAWGALMSPPGLADDAVWGCFSSAVSPARHGRYNFKVTRPGSYESPYFKDEDFQHETFWSALDARGKKVAVIDVPKSPLAEMKHGLHVADWFVHGRDHHTAVSSPAWVAPDLEQRIGAERIDRPGEDDYLCLETALSQGRYDELLNALHESLLHKLQGSIELLQQGDWDMFLTVFKESHCVGHQFWHLLDKTHALYDPSLVEMYGNPVKDIYVALDTALGRLLECVDEKTRVIVFSDLGMGPNHTGEHFLDAILERLEKAERSWFETGSLLLRRELDRLAGSLRAGHSLQYRRYFQLVHNEISGAVRLNQTGREPQGRIGTGEVEQTLHQLTKDLLELVDPVTGRPIVKEVLRTSELFTGEHLARLPDLLVVWHRDAPISGARSDKIGVVHNKTPNVRPGNHFCGGIWFARGPGFSGGEQTHTPSIMDIGPTVARFLGVELPDVDGRPFKGAVVRHA
jgi:predicted AlkP superfamily phosphohydrolase/phosphomutase